MSKLFGVDRSVLNVHTVWCGQVCATCSHFSVGVGPYYMFTLLGVGSSVLHVHTVWCGQVRTTCSHCLVWVGPYYKYRTWAGLYEDPWNPAVSGQGEQSINQALRHRQRAHTTQRILGFHILLSRAVAPEPHRFGFIFPPGSGSSR